MAEKPITEFPYEASVTVQEKYLKRGKHFAVLPMDDALSSLIGRVTAYWAYYETMLHQLIGQLLEAADVSELNWQRRSFAKRASISHVTCCPRPHFQLRMRKANSASKTT